MDIEVKGSVLRSYRVNRNMTLRAMSERTNITEVELEAYENSGVLLPKSTLERLAKALKISWLAFLDDEPELPMHFGQDNRTRNHQGEVLDADTQNVIEEAAYLLDLINEVKPEEGFDANGIRLQRGSPEYVAEKFREYLEINSTEIATLGDDYAVLRFWKEKLSNKGLYIFEKSWTVSSVRAFSLIRGNKAAAVLSTKDSALARVFSLLHEACHIIHNQTGVCDLHYSSENDAEVMCNRFAAAVLMPEDEFRAIASGLRIGVEGSVHENQVKELRKVFKTSRLATYRRLLTLGYISSSSYEEVQDEYEQSWMAPPQVRSGGSYYRNRLNEVGKKYANDMLAAYANNQISIRNLADVLKVRVNQLPQITNLIGGNGNGT